MVSRRVPIFRRPRPVADLPEPRLWTCEQCTEPMRVWDWDVHAVGPTVLPPRICSACRLDLAPASEKDQLYEQFRQALHHEMYVSVGEPPGTLVAWDVWLLDRSDRTDASGTRTRYRATVFAVCVDWWNEDWLQMVLPWQPNASEPLGVVLGAHVFGTQSAPCRWRFRWWWPDPSWPEVCELLPSWGKLTDDEAVMLNRARGAFYEFQEERGRKRGTTSYTADDLKERVPIARAAWLARHGRKPYDTELAAEIGVSEATFKRYKSRGMIPPP